MKTQERQEKQEKQERLERINLDMQLTEHFRLREFTRSATALDMGIDNTPPREAVALLKALCENVLEPLRRRFGVIRITSGYRCEILNRIVGGVPHSQHLYGEAADIQLGSREEGLRMIKFLQEQGIPFDQALLEHNRQSGSRWLHLSYRPLHSRRQVSTNVASNVATKNLQKVI